MKLLNKYFSNMAIADSISAIFLFLKKGKKNHVSWKLVATANYLNLSNFYCLLNPKYYLILLKLYGFNSMSYITMRETLYELIQSIRWNIKPSRASLLITNWNPVFRCYTIYVMISFWIILVAEGNQSKLKLCKLTGTKIQVNQHSRE